MIPKCTTRPRKVEKSQNLLKDLKVELVVFIS